MSYIPRYSRVIPIAKPDASSLCHLRDGIAARTDENSLERSRTQRKLVARSIIIHTDVCAYSKFNPQTGDALAWGILWFSRPNDTNNAHENTLVSNAHFVARARLQWSWNFISIFTYKTDAATSDCVRARIGIISRIWFKIRVRFNTQIWDCVLRYFFFHARQTRFFGSSRLRTFDWLVWDIASQIDHYHVYVWNKRQF